MSNIRLEKLTLSHLVKKFPVFYGTRNLITVLTRAHSWIYLEPDEPSGLRTVTVTVIIIIIIIIIINF
jgi:hypothetical protein